MRGGSVISACLAMLLLAAGAVSAFGQNPGQGGGQNVKTQLETKEEMIAKLTPAQKQIYDAAGKANFEQRYEEALQMTLQLAAMLPGDAFLQKLAAESALNSGKQAQARSIIEPVANANPEDWKAAALLARACQELGDKDCQNKMQARADALRLRGLADAEPGK
jgi:predicted Zn-dependent protease